MNRILFYFIVIFILASLIPAKGQGIILSQNNKSGLYKAGEKISVTACGDIKTGDSLWIRVWKNNNQLVENKVIMMSRDTFPVFTGSFEDPCSVIVEVSNGRETSGLGLLSDAEKIKPPDKRPEDFMKYWRIQKKKLNAMPLTENEAEIRGYRNEDGYSCVDLEINCPGSKSARGYFARPEKAKIKSLPAVLLVHAAGVKGSWCRSEPENAMKYARMGALCFDLNAHGMLNGQSESYYADLESGELRNYFYQGLTNRDEFYFKGMYLRLLRAIEFLARQPEWDGKRMLVMGESQGGGQALVSAGLDRRVSAVVAIVPAMCDWLGELGGRRGGWPQPYESNTAKEEMLEVLPYFDAANIIAGSKATLFVEIGLIDNTCPSTSVYAAINQSIGKTIIYPVPYRPHQKPQGKLAELWEETVFKPREQFIKDYLK